MAKEPIYRPKTGTTAGKLNRARVRAYLISNPNATCVEIARELKLSRQSVGTHLKSFVPSRGK